MPLKQSAPLMLALSLLFRRAIRKPVPFPQRKSSHLICSMALRG